ncbi:MAG: hypothetical protein N3E47_01535 [Candidatus Bathyarchaeota archaeon]|nr:hypothetical protein [Candidatus Bathyarchaeota archaeon]
MVTPGTLSPLKLSLLDPIYAIFLLSRFPESASDAGILLTIFGSSSAIFKMVADEIIDIHGEKEVFSVGVILSALCLLAYTSALIATATVNIAGLWYFMVLGLRGRIFEAE